MISLALWALAWAELPPPDYRAALVAAAEQEIDRQIAAGDLAAARALVERFRQEIIDDPRLIYEEGLIDRLSGDQRRALALFREAVEEDPSLAHAWYDLGELLLLSGDLEEAKQAFAQASDRSEDHPQGWAGPFRLAELAGREGDPVVFERWLREALRRGFSFRVVLEDPVWRGFLSSPELGEVLRRLATVYGNEDVIRAWEGG